MLDMINLASIPIFLLIFIRILSFFVMMPLFSYRTIPLPFKLGISFFLALITFYTVDQTGVDIDRLFIFLVLKEALVGLCLGLLAYVILSAVLIAGGYIVFQMDFSITNVVDLQTGAQSHLISQYIFMIYLF